MIEKRGRLLSHFQEATKDTQASQWDDLWNTGEHELWDRGHASHALEDYMQSADCLLSPRDGGGNPRRALVPGCGTGYDPVMLAEHGFEAWGLEVSAQAVKSAEEYARSVKGYAANGKSHVEANSSEPGRVNFVVGDFFAPEWQSSLPFADEKFDLVYDYTVSLLNPLTCGQRMAYHSARQFLCALLPESRKDWANRMAELVKPGSFLICLEFPLWKESSSSGPPWGMVGVYGNLLAEGGDGLVGLGAGNSGGPGKGQFERVQYIKPARSYKQGRGTDMLSVWRRKEVD